tara:strand:+ start:369 stop:593 length:225 start_codon:yes stop_codon:yes gene_type:complete
MNDFKKGLLVGMFIIIGCGTFIASNSNDDVGRYVLYKSQVTASMLDTKTGDFFLYDNDKKYWTKKHSIKPNEEQ